MNFSKSLLALALSGILFVSCKNNEAVNATTETANASSEPTTSNSTAENLQTASFSIDGMSCAVGCAKTIEKKLAGLDGVQEAKVDYENKSATVSYDASKQTPETLLETVEAQADGKTYKVSNLKSSGDKAMLFKEKEKEKNKKKKDAKKAASVEETSKDAKPACCSGKKSCSKDEEKEVKKA